MSVSSSPRKEALGGTIKHPVNSVMNVRRQHPALGRVLSKSEVEPSDSTCEQLLRQAEVLLTTIGYKNGKLVPKLLTKTPERYRRDIRAPGPSFVPPLNLDSFDPETDSALKIPMRTKVSPEKPLPTFREVPRTPKRQLISVRQSRPETNRSGRPSDSQVRARTLREALQVHEMSPEERAFLRKKSEEHKQLLTVRLRASLSRKLSRSNKLGIFSKQANKVREDSLFSLAMTVK